MDWEPAVSSIRAKWVSEDELEHRKEQGCCLRCASKQHFIKQCPCLPSLRRKGNIKTNHVTVPDDALLDDEFVEGAQTPKNA